VTVAVAALAALPASFLTIRGLLRTPAARHVVAAPRQDRWHTRSTPLLGGSGILAGLLIAAGIAIATPRSCTSPASSTTSSAYRRSRRSPRKLRLQRS
jgi:UDP-N-acetylmuramyl pentapeptide phosphotransferase/UDP-N-acetylglucosamine-1-phosphate transferase